MPRTAAPGRRSSSLDMPHSPRAPERKHLGVSKEQRGSLSGAHFVGGHAVGRRHFDLQADRDLRPHQPRQVGDHLVGDHAGVPAHPLRIEHDRAVEAARRGRRGGRLGPPGLRRQIGPISPISPIGQPSPNRPRLGLGSQLRQSRCWLNQQTRAFGRDRHRLAAAQPLLCLLGPLPFFLPPPRQGVNSIALWRGHTDGAPGARDTG
jgi:hypothetical protein